MSNIQDKNLKKMYLILSMEWDTDFNGGIPSAEEIQDIAYKTVSWKCPYCGIKWKDQISNRLRGHKPCNCSR